MYFSYLQVARTSPWVSASFCAWAALCSARTRSWFWTRPRPPWTRPPTTSCRRRCSANSGERRSSPSHTGWSFVWRIPAEPFDDFRGRNLDDRRFLKINEIEARYLWIGFFQSSFILEYHNSSAPTKFACQYFFRANSVDQHILRLWNSGNVWVCSKAAFPHRTFFFLLKYVQCSLVELIFMSLWNVWSSANVKMEIPVLIR